MLNSIILPTEKRFSSEAMLPPEDTYGFSCNENVWDALRIK